MPDELARKLGLRPGQAVLLIDAPPSAHRRLRDVSPAGVRFVRSAKAAVDQVFWWPKDLSGLALALARLQKRLQTDGAVWIVMPKKPFAAARGIGFTWEAMQAEGLKGDFVDNKIASFDEQDYATRFVVRKSRRTKPT
jgi:hypothetical protein